MTEDPSRYFTSRIITTLDQRIREAKDNTTRNVLFAQKAIALARFSLIGEARTLVQQLRKVNPSYEARLSAWIMFAEGVIEHAEHLNMPKAKDRILRAHLVAQAANDPGLAATAAAWLAYFTFVEGKYLETKDYLKKAFAWSIEEDWEARSRGCMVLGSGFYFAGELEKAKAWFQRARDAAVKSGDVAMQNTILFNASAFHVSQLTLLDCIGLVDETELNFAVMSSRSVSNLNTALGIANQPSMIALQRAELFTLERKWSEALELFDLHIDQGIAEGQSKWAPKFYAQRAWCKANLGNYDGARSDIQQALNEGAQNFDPDDCAVLHLRISAAAKLLGQTELENLHLNEGNTYLALHREHQALIRAYFDEVVDSLPK